MRKTAGDIILTPELRNKVIRAQRSEVTEYHIYKSLAREVTDKDDTDLLNAIADEELKHYKFWMEFSGKEVDPDWWMIRKYFWISKVFGLSFGIKLMERGEGKARINYTEIAREIPGALKIAMEENVHELALVDMFGPGENDYTVQNPVKIMQSLLLAFGVMCIFTALQFPNMLIALLGLSVGIAGILAFISGQYVSSSVAKLVSKYAWSLAALVILLLQAMPFMLFVKPIAALITSTIITFLLASVITFFQSVVKNEAHTKLVLNFIIWFVIIGVIGYGSGFLIKSLLNI